VQDETSVRAPGLIGPSDLHSHQLPFKLTAPPWRSATIPLSAFISTVISGFERFYDTPRAVPYVTLRSFISHPASLAPLRPSPTYHVSLRAEPS